MIWKNGKTYEIKDDGTEIECIDILKRFPVKMFSQKQLLEYTKNTRMLMDYIDEDWDCVSWKEKYDDLKLKYVECKNGLIGLRSQQLKREQILVQLEDLQKKISVFETNATKQLLVNQTKYYNQKDIMNLQI